MQDLVGIVRKEDEMREALGSAKALRRAPRASASAAIAEYNSGWHMAVDLPSLLTISEAVATAAIERKESRGAQFRDDYPAKSETFSTFNMVIQKGEDGAMTLSRAPVPPIPPELTQVIEENK